MPRFRLTLMAQREPAEKTSRYLKAVISDAVGHPVQVSLGVNDKGGLLTYIIESPTGLSPRGLELMLGRLERRLGKVRCVDVVSDRWELTFVAPCNKVAAEAAQLYNNATKSFIFEYLAVKDRNLKLTTMVDDNIDRDQIVKLVLDIPGINKVKLVEAKIFG